MNKRLKILKGIVWLIVYIAMIVPTIYYTTNVATEHMGRFVLAGYFITMEYSIIFTLYVSSKFVDWLFKGVEK